MLRSFVVSKEKEEEEEEEEKGGSNSNPRPLYLLRQGRVNRKRQRSGQIAKGNGRSHACRQTRPASPWGPGGVGGGLRKRNVRGGGRDGESKMSMIEGARVEERECP
ncbi:hypothetical protein NL676_002954 [Syzygium grande]|nr:hypothetical protein NL676_002954 [Syzygium grande]